MAVSSKKHFYWLGVAIDVVCEKESFLSDDYARYKELLPNKKEYVDDDLGTQALAKSHRRTLLFEVIYDLL